MTDHVQLNPGASSWRWCGHDTSKASASSAVLDFHRTLPSYGRTPLHSLSALAAELGLGRVMLKDESDRFGLPSFKILGASYGVFRAVADKLDIPVTDHSPSLELLGSEARSHGLTLVTCTEGNWGRAVARMAKHLGIPTKIFVPSFMPVTTQALIRREGAELVVVNGNYDDGVAAAKQEAANDGSLLVMDFGWEGYEIIPQWVVDGYSTMLNESDEQVVEHTATHSVTHAFVPVGVGSIAQAVTQHFKDSRRTTGHAKVITVEPTTAASLKTSLESGTMSSIPTEDTIMCGMNCGTVSTTAWPILEDGVDASVIVTDVEAHQAVQDLKTLGVDAGPCGAATLAALRRAVLDKGDELGLNQNSVVVLYCTEGPREYEIPKITSSG
ncbi:tryptophan synthase beta subunit-like PLP-dependent enzyme [Coniochaeta ligniaria NRRL 30616]|uniref:Tryptophan synthase beta subunit-like PLP-dependent enzyme n=1 Tax=Coniochaeta ligniaria NRRL 30616 TaxID=1408157 RepID=A0A1J7I8P2_9PEZI|nr:tryptophan synthase beta subunit-like PLP-dependent enzyme [Coniochaeta ligniaria NRRL 30616]